MAGKEGEGRKDGRRRGRKMRIQAMVTPEKVGERGGGVGGEGDVAVEVEDGFGGSEVVVGQTAGGWVGNQRLRVMVVVGMEGESEM